MTNNPQSPTSDVPDGEIIQAMLDAYARTQSTYIGTVFENALSALRATYNVTITRKP